LSKRQIAHRLAQPARVFRRMIKLLLVGLFVVFAVTIVISEGRDVVSLVGRWEKIFISGNKIPGFFVLSMEIKLF
jgi:hypothetical protein